MTKIAPMPQPKNLATDIETATQDKKLNKTEIESLVKLMAASPHDQATKDLLQPLADNIASGALKISNLNLRQKIGKALAKFGLDSSTFQGNINRATWAIGSGIQVSYSGPVVEVYAHPQLKITPRVRLENNTVFVTLSGKYSGPLTAPADVLTKVQPGSPPGIQFNRKYNLVVEDDAGKKLFATTFVSMPPA